MTAQRQGEDVRTVTTDDGVRLHVRLGGPAAAPAILMSNSLATDLHMWDAVSTQLAGRFRVVRYDTCGHGRSEARTSCTIARLGRDALAVLDDLGLERVMVCGLSLGGAVGMWLAIEAPALVSRLIVANTAAVFPPPDLWRRRAEEALSAGMSPTLAPTLERWFTPAYRAAHPEVMDAVGAMIEGTSLTGYAAACGALGALDLRAGLGGIRCPTRVIVGRADPSTPPSCGEQIRDAVPGADLVTLAAAHMSAIEDAAGFVQAVTEFAAPH